MELDLDVAIQASDVLADLLKKQITRACEMANGLALGHPIIMAMNPHLDAARCAVANWASDKSVGATLDHAQSAAVRLTQCYAALSGFLQGVEAAGKAAALPGGWQVCQNRLN